MPVTVELWPAAIKAMANNLGARFPKKPGSSLYASFISATSELPDLKKTLAAKISIAAFTKNAIFKATVVSIKLNLSACFIPFSVLFILRVCTKAECR